MASRVVWAGALILMASSSSFFQTPRAVGAEPSSRGVVSPSVRARSETAGTLRVGSLAASGPIDTNVNLYGYANDAAGCSIIANNLDAAAMAAVVGGFDRASTRNRYGGLDQVTCYGENTANPPVYQALGGVSFSGAGGRTAVLTTALSDAALARLKPGMIVETTNLFRGLLQSWSSKSLTVDFWEALASTPPIMDNPGKYGSRLGLEVGGTDQIWGWNINLTLAPGMWTKPDANGRPRSGSMIGAEYALINDALPFQRDEFRPFEDFPRSWGQFMSCSGRYPCGSGYFTKGDFDKGYTNSDKAGTYAGFLGSSTAATPALAEFASQLNSGNLIAAKPGGQHGTVTYAVDTASGTTTLGQSRNHQTVITTVGVDTDGVEDTFLTRDGKRPSAGNLIYKEADVSSLQLNGRLVCLQRSTMNAAAWALEATYVLNGQSNASKMKASKVSTTETSAELGSITPQLGLDGENASPTITIRGLADVSCTASITLTIAR